VNDETQQEGRGGAPLDRLGELSAGRRHLLRRVLGAEALGPEQIPIRPRAAGGGALPLSRAQEAMWVVSRLAQGGVYNLPAAVRLTGALDIDALRAAVAAIVARHEILRTGFPARGGRPVQAVLPARQVEIPVIDCPEADLAERARALARRDFDLAGGPLFRLVLYRLAPHEHVLLSVWHHLIWDGWSIDHLAAQLVHSLAAAPAPPPSLPRRTCAKRAPACGCHRLRA
jgi:hypothetical protein